MTYPVHTFAKEGTADAAAKPKDDPATASAIVEATTSCGAFTCGLFTLLVVVAVIVDSCCAS